MSEIVSRHIRHDWQTWNDDQNQKTIRSICNVRTKPHLAGIPGVTSQPFWVTTKAGDVAFGWCWQCSRIFARIIGTEVPPGVPAELYPVFERAFVFAKVIRTLEKRNRENGISVYKTPFEE